MSAYMEKIMKATGQSIPKNKRILEINTGHPVIEKIKRIHDQNGESERLKSYGDLLYDLAIIGEGGKIENPSRFSKLVADIMAEAIG